MQKQSWMNNGRSNNKSVRIIVWEEYPSVWILARGHTSIYERPWIELRKKKEEAVNSFGNRVHEPEFEHTYAGT